MAIKQSSQHHQDDTVDSPDTPMVEPSAPYNPQGASAPYNPQEPSSPTMPQHQDEPKPPKVDVTSGSALPRNPVTNNCIGAPGFEGNKHMERCVFVRIATTKHTRTPVRTHTHTHTYTHIHTHTHTYTHARAHAYSINCVWKVHVHSIPGGKLNA